jgi:2-methylisocitrate lyase-like PEP mutase family enzyme
MLSAPDMDVPYTRRRHTRKTLDQHASLQLPAAHDALTAKLIARARFHAYQIGGFALKIVPMRIVDVPCCAAIEKRFGARP